MKLDPVYVVAPERMPRTVPTRRAFLLAGVAGVVGAGGGYGLSQLLGREPKTSPGRTELDPMLRWLLTLCDDSSPIEELIQYRAALLQALPRHKDNSSLWHGLARLAVAAETIPDDRDSRRVAAELLDFLEHGPSEPDGVMRIDRVRLQMLVRGR